MTLVYRPFNAATDGVFGQDRKFCMSTSGFLCRVVARPRPAGGGRKRKEKRYFRDDIDYEALRARARKRRDQQDMRDLTALIRILTKAQV